MNATTTVGEYMTPSPHSVAVDRKLADAHKLMRQYKIRHLPVLEGGALVGLVSERDLALVETLRDVDPAEVEVEEAMSPDPYVVSSDTPLQEVAITMWKKKYGSAVVKDGKHIAGVFTTTDALRVLVTMLATAPKKPAKAAPAPKRQAATRTRARAAR